MPKGKSFQFQNAELQLILKNLPKRLLLGLFEYKRLTVLELSDLDMFYMPNHVKRLFNPSTEGDTPEWLSIIRKLQARGGLYKFLNSNANDARKLWDLAIKRDFGLDPDDPTTYSKLFAALTQYAHDPEIPSDPRVRGLIESGIYYDRTPKERYSRMTRMGLVDKCINMLGDQPLHWLEAVGDEDLTLLLEYHLLTIRNKFEKINSYYSALLLFVKALIESKRVNKYPILTNAAARTAMGLPTGKFIDVANFLLVMGANPNQAGTTAYGYTPLTAALYMKEDEQIVPLLLANGADVNQENLRRKETPVGLASRNGDIATVRRLLAQGADPNKPHDGDAALLYAAMHGYIEIVRLLLQYGADINRVRSDHTALEWARMLEYTELVELLEAAAAQPMEELPFAEEWGMEAANAQAMTALPFTASWDMMYAPAAAVIALDNNIHVEVNHHL